LTLEWADRSPAVLSQPLPTRFCPEAPPSRRNSLFDPLSAHTDLGQSGPVRPEKRFAALKGHSIIRLCLTTCQLFAELFSE
jgi:hypothetical protein